MGALRRPQLSPEDRDLVHVPDIGPQPVPGAYPRWIVISGVVIYCCVFWTFIWVASSTGIEWVRAAAAAAPH